MKKNFPTRSKRFRLNESNWLSKVLMESMKDPRLNKSTPRKNRISAEIVSGKNKSSGLALFLNSRKIKVQKFPKSLKFGKKYRDMSKWSTLPICGFYDDFDDEASFDKLYEKMLFSISREFSEFCRSEEGKKFKSNCGL